MAQRSVNWVSAVVLVCSLGVIAGRSAHGAEPPSPPRPTSTLLWRGEKAAGGGAISPDGRYISFVDWSTGNLCLHDVATGKDRSIVQANNPARGDWKAYAEASAISRDGEKIAYSWFNASSNAYELWVASLVGDPRPRRLSVVPRVPWLEPRDWSPDGKWVAVVAHFEDRTTRLGVVSTQDGAFRPLKTVSALVDSNMFFSPDGAFLAYDLPTGATIARDVWLIAVDGTGDAAVVASRGDDLLMGWSPDGRRLIFASDRTGAMALWALRIVGGRPQGPQECLKSDLGLVKPMGMTKAGELFYSALPGRRGGSIQLAGFDLASGALAAPRDVSVAPEEDNVNPSWSPDGEYLAYVSQRGRPGAAPIFVIRDGKSAALVREIEPKLRRAELAGWEPNGEALLAVGADFAGQAGAFRIDRASGDASFLFAAPSAPTLSMPVWSADGRTIYYWTRVGSSGEHAFRSHDVGSGAEKEILRRSFLGELGRSPDGQWLATETVDPEKGERVLLLLSLKTGATRELMRLPAGVSQSDLKNVAGRGACVSVASWAPGSRSVIARLQREPEGESELWDIPVDGQPRRLASSLAAHIFAFKISADGRRVAYRFKEPGPLAEPQVWKFSDFLPD